MASPFWLIIPVSALIVKQYKCCIKLLNLTSVSEYSQTSSYLACAMLSVSPQPPRGFRASLEQATNGNLCTTASPQWPHFCLNWQPKNSFLFNKPLSLKNDHLFTGRTTPAPGRLGERSSGCWPCKTQHSLIWIASQPLKQPLHNGDLKRQCQADIAVLGQFCAESII